MSSPSRCKVVTQPTEGVCGTKSTQNELLSPSHQEVIIQWTGRGCHHQVDKRSSHSRPMGVVVTKSTEGRHTVDRRGCCHQVDTEGMSSPIGQERGCHHQVDRRSSHSWPKGLPSPGRQEGDCHHQVDKLSSHSRPKGLSSPSRQKVVTQSTNGVAITKSARRGCRHQVDKRSSHSRPKERGHQVAHTGREGSPTQPTEKGRGHQVNPRREGGDTKSTHRKVAGRINWSIETGRLQGKCRAHTLGKAKENGWRSSIVYRYKRRKTLHLYTQKRPYSAKPSITTESEADYQCRS